MSKKSEFPVFVPRALALAFTAFVCGSFAQLANQPLDVIIRDFPVDHLGFEMFDSDRNTNGVCAGSNPAEPNAQARRPENGICVNNGEYVQCIGEISKMGDNWSYSRQLLYGEYQESGTCQKVGGKNKRGYKVKLAGDAENTIKGDIVQGCEGGPWQNPVFVTKGMVQGDLDYSQCEGRWVGEDSDSTYRRGRYCARPLPGNGACYGENLHEWFTDGGAARRFEDVMILDRVGNTSTYMIEYDYNKINPDWGDRGYFPLDTKEGTYGKQSLNLWCGAHFPDDPCKNETGINYWRNGATAQRYVNEGKVAPNLIHNYGFTMAGSAEFKYKNEYDDTFEFIGDDDMWIFIDGKLAVDLGGTHLAAPAKIKIRDYAQKQGNYAGRPGEVWENESMHAINFFYADRQTDGSNMMIKLAITELTPSQFGAPYIKKAETEMSDDGSKTETLLYVSSQLFMPSIDGFKNGNIGHGFPIIVFNYNDNKVYGYKLETMSAGIRSEEGGYIYVITGVVCKDPSCNETIPLASGDSLSFNVIATGEGGFATSYPGSNVGFALSDESKYIENTIRRQSTEIKMGENKTSRKVDITVNTPDTKPKKPPFAGGNPENFTGNGNPSPDGSVPPGAGGPVPGGDGAYDGSGKFPNIRTVWSSKANGGKGGMVNIADVDGAKNNNNVHGFGTIGAPIPSQRAGELILTAFPNALVPPQGFTSYEEWETHYKEHNKEKDADLFGLPPETKGDAWWGLVDPTTEARGGGYQFVKNGFPNESSTKGNIKIAPTRCTAIIDEGAEAGKRASINCLNFNMVAQQPFQLAVTVYDQLGNFVTQYRETITEQDFRNVTQAPNYLFNRDQIKTAAGRCEEPKDDNYGSPNTTTTNGVINVNVNIYPFSTTGRRFGNGVYIAKIDRVDLPFSGCQVLGGIAGKNDQRFIRFHSEQKFGWMRAERK